MPLPKTGREGLGTFQGINLRRDTLTLAEGEMERVINADLHTMPGVVRLRKGRTAQSETPLPDAIRYIGRHNNRLYQIAGTTLYRVQTSILVALSLTMPTRLVAYKPLNDTTTWVFIADATAGMYKDNGTTLYAWGLRRPTVPTLAVGIAGVLTGDYTAVYTYARVVSGNIAHESNPSATPDAIALTNDQLDVTVTASTDPQVTHIRIYRTVAGGSTLLFDQQVPNVDDTIASTVADGSLGAAVETDNDRPPVVAWITEYQGHIFFLQDPDEPDHLWWSKRFRPESVPSENFLRMGTADDPLQCAIPMTGFLGVFSRKSKYRVSGNATSGFTYAEALNTRGTMAPQAVLATSRGVGFWARDGLWGTNFIGPDVEWSQLIQPLFYGETVNDYAPIDWDKTLELSLAEYKKRFYAGYVDTTNQRMLAVYSQDTSQWYHYEQPHRSLYSDESVDELLMGGMDGLIYVLEEGTDDAGTAIAMEATVATRGGGDRYQLKHFLFFRLDLYAHSATTVQLFVDDTVVYTFVVPTGTRASSKALRRLPDELLGYTWKVRYTGAFDLYACEMWGVPLEVSL